MNAVELKLFTLFKAKLGQEEAETFFEYIDNRLGQTVTEKSLDERQKIFATKEDLAKGLADVRKEVSEAKAEMIKWMFIFWAGSIITTLGGMFAFLKLFLEK